MKKIIAPVFAASLLITGCSSFGINGAKEAASVSETHPITVEQQTMTLTISADPSLSELTQIDRARLNAFTSAYFTKGRGPITVTAPSGGPNDFYGQELAADIRSALHAQGVNWADMLGATYRVPGTSSTPEVILSFSTYVASTAKCGDWSEEYFRRTQNLRSKNFGCANQQNMAAMLADPGDLIEPAAMAPADATRQGVITDAFRAGEITSSAEDDAVSVSASE